MRKRATTRVFHITDEIFQQFLNTNSVRNNFTDGIIDRNILLEKFYRKTYIFGDLYFVGQYVCNIITIGFTDKNNMHKQKKINWY